MATALMRRVFRLLLGMSTFVGRIQAWAAVEFRTTVRHRHQLPWTMFVLMVWMLTRPPFLVMFAAAKALHKEVKARDDAAIAARLGGGHVRGTSAKPKAPGRPAPRE